MTNPIGEPLSVECVAGTRCTLTSPIRISPPMFPPFDCSGGSSSDDTHSTIPITGAPLSFAISFAFAEWSPCECVTQMAAGLSAFL